MDNLFHIPISDNEASDTIGEIVGCGDSGDSTPCPEASVDAVAYTVMDITDTDNDNLFGGEWADIDGTIAARKAARSPGKKKKNIKKRILISVASVFFVGVVGYLTFVFSNIEPIANLRTTYILTAMSTLHHKWLATAFIPDYIIDDVMAQQQKQKDAMVGKESQWTQPTFKEDPPKLDQGMVPAVVSSDIESAVEDTISDEKLEQDAEYEAALDIFLSIYYELDRESFDAYLKKNPDTLDSGWSGIDINETGLKDNGTDIYTTSGEQVLALDAANGILLIRVYVAGSRGVLAICKDTSRLSLYPSSQLGVCGETLGSICKRAGGILAITGSPFLDNGYSNGGQISGLAVCSGTVYGTRLGYGEKRLELRKDNLMYIVDSTSSVGEGTRDACEFGPALIIDGTVCVDNNSGWTSQNPRAILGQNDHYEAMMLVVEGRFLDSPGCSLVPAAQLLADHGCMQALNLDGGTSALMYYKGEEITRCSNTAIPQGRTLPTAWVYK